MGSEGGTRWDTSEVKVVVGVDGVLVRGKGGGWGTNGG